MWIQIIGWYVRFWKRRIADRKNTFFELKEVQGIDIIQIRLYFKRRIWAA